MQFIVSIDSRTSTGKMLIHLLSEFRKRKTVQFLTENELEELEDHALGQLIEKGKTGRYVDVDKFLKKLKGK